MLLSLFGKHNGKMFGPCMSQWKNNQWCVRLNMQSWNEGSNQQSEESLLPEPQTHNSVMARRSSSASPSKDQGFGELALPGSLGKTNLAWPLNSSYTVCLSKNENLLTQEKRAWEPLCNATTHQHPLFVNYISSFHPSEKQSWFD